ncbi:BglG family transcription antiterminator [Domibacillus sp. A3M-37]|uniref:BglG family transcription antiterminator n=1 Tax=Domibacillus sp. A3M-37 TaxID=2962037 RepID=UPI0020B6AF35|nr:BglG family transcription antiterminator [Domibacillus sp. A3M-37]MCP3764808.1 BglG family transcription antiterminator [Domibacillus sp. A3M-37]
MFLDERSAALLKILQNSPNLKMKELEAQTGLTRRQIQYSLGKANDWLQLQGYRLIRHDRESGYFLPEKIPNEQVNIRLTKRTYAFSETDRDKVYSLMILLSQEELSVYHFQSVTGLSRNTVLKDLQRLKEKLQQTKLVLQYSKQAGYIIKGRNRLKRYVVEQLVHDVLNSSNSQLIIECVWGDNKKQIGSIRLHLERMEHELGIIFTDERLQELTYLFLCTDQLINKGEELDEDKNWTPFVAAEEYKMIEQMVKTNAFQSEWNQTEKLYATLHLLSMNRTKDISPLEEDKVIYTLLQKITEEFERLACVHLQEKELFFQQLYIHFKPAYYRLKYGLLQTNPMTERVQKVYPELHHMVKKSLVLLEKEIGGSIPEDEAAYFTLHFGGWLRRQGTTLDDRKRAIVVCPNGVGISNILIYTLRELFPDILFLDVLSVRNAAEYPLSYDLVFSTVHLRTGATLFVVPAILEAKDKHKLRQQVIQELYGYTIQNVNVSALLKVISKYATIHEVDQLEKALESNSYNYTSKTNNYSLEEAGKPVLEQLINLQTIQIQKRVSDWKEGIKVAAQPLIDLGTIEDRYVDSIIEALETNGPYMVITPGVAIPHSRPEHGVRSLSMSLLKLDEPVNFAPDKPVQLIIVLAAVDNDSHLRALMQLTQLLSEPANIEEMVNASDKSMLMEYVHKYSKEETK